ncbi:MAG: response regulator [Cyclobacteriaceae bacterium]
MKNWKAEILLVEDRHEDAYLTHFALEKSGYGNMINWVQDGQEALDYLLCSGAYAERDIIHPKLILMDLNMPKMNGLEALKLIKQNPKLSMIPVVMLTTSDQDVDRFQAYSDHVNSYIVKPVDSDKFKKVISDMGNYWIGYNVLID